MEPLFREPKRRTVSIYIFAGIGVVAFIGLSIASSALYQSLSGRGGYTSGGSYDGEYACNTLGINLHGDIVTYIPPESITPDTEGEVAEDMVASEDIVSIIEQATSDDSIQAIMLDIDSPGGYPVAAEEIATAIKNSKKPTVAVIRQTGTSAAYWIASATDHVVASRNSDVGSIGVTMSYVRTMNEPGQYVELSSGKFKDAGDPDKAITAEERSILMRDVSLIHKNFIEAVALNRNLSVEKVTSFADGSSVLGEQAKTLGLVDEIGSWDEAKRYLEGRIGEPVSICWQ